MAYKRIPSTMETFISKIDEFPPEKYPEFVARYLLLASVSYHDCLAAFFRAARKMKLTRAQERAIAIEIENEAEALSAGFLESALFVHHKIIPVMHANDVFANPKVQEFFKHRKLVKATLSKGPTHYSRKRQLLRQRFFAELLATSPADTAKVRADEAYRKSGLQREFMERHNDGRFKPSEYVKWETAYRWALKEIERTSKPSS